jgi:hypothetical protein
MRILKLLASPLEKKVGEHLAALFGEKAGCDFDFVVELGVVHDGKDRAAGPGFGVGRGVDEAADAGVEDGSGAHGAGFERGVEGAVFEAVVRESAAGFAEGYDLGVGGGVAVAEDSVLASAYDFILVDDDCAYRDFAVGFGVVSFGDGKLHQVVVGARVGGRVGVHTFLSSTRVDGVTTIVVLESHRGI